MPGGAGPRGGGGATGRGAEAGPGPPRGGGGGPPGGGGGGSGPLRARGGPEGGGGGGGVPPLPWGPARRGVNCSISGARGGGAAGSAVGLQEATSPRSSWGVGGGSARLTLAPHLLLDGLQPPLPLDEVVDEARGLGVRQLRLADASACKQRPQVRVQRCSLHPHGPLRTPGLQREGFLTSPPPHTHTAHTYIKAIGGIPADVADVPGGRRGLRGCLTSPPAPRAFPPPPPPHVHVSPVSPTPPPPRSLEARRGSNVGLGDFLAALLALTARCGAPRCGAGQPSVAGRRDVRVGDGHSWQRWGCGSSGGGGVGGLGAPPGVEKPMG